ncbi:SpoIIE family protein phosphatase [Streptomyces sp. WMMB 322]|uniref:ATP-binding SpoIIE family protein phosphatase n=1 Tax=Streptomyces sp. WMMB 322 TaxID=1286821 RepID=UPI0006E2D4D4|nr:SpoIIE family protein phosphatase [Streptomyces sp. WMMB 322]SCK16478.1 Serine phosphatase RsbU, regulator of sigma subunit [Streptomyces sp. WMMB 322]
MHTEDVLRATRTGLWRWDSETGASTVDVLTAELLGVPVRRGHVAESERSASVAGPGSEAPAEEAEEAGPEQTGPEEAGPGAREGPAENGTLTLAEPSTRSRIHFADYLELTESATLAIAEWTLVESVLRVVDEEGRVVRRVRTRMMPVEEDGKLSLIGTISEVPEPGAAEPAAGEDVRPRAAESDLHRSRDAFLLHTSLALAEARTTAEVLRIAGSLVIPGLKPRALAVFSLERGRLILVGPPGQRPVPQHLLPFLEMSVEADHPAAAVVRSGRPVYLPAPEDYRREYPAAWPQVEPIGNRGWAFLPLTVSKRTLGAWMVAFPEPVEFTREDRSLLANVARVLAQAISRTSMHETELQLSSGLQRTLRPTRRPGIEGMKLAARYMPSGGGLEVGGDWYDVIPLPSGRTGLVIGDVQGHDVRAAGVMAQLRIAMRAYAAEGHRPDALLARASRYLAGIGRPEALTGYPEEVRGGTPPSGAAPPVAGTSGGLLGDERFATCLYMEADPVTGTLDIARAGHPDPAIWLADGTMLIRATAGGLPLGVEPGTEYPMTRLVLEPGETLLVCTDGLIEVGGHTMDTGWRRIQAVFREVSERHTGTPADLEQLADALIDSTQQPLTGEGAGPLADRREDDIALLLLTLDPAFAAERAAAVAGVARRTTFTVAQAEPDRIGEARHQLQGMLFDWESEDQIDGAVLMLSEMLTNVLVHTEGDAMMVAECSGKRGNRLLRVEVADTSDALPHRRTPGELASSGRGLMMMEMLAGSWGVDPRGEGKSIWFEMRENVSSPAWA